MKKESTMEYFAIKRLPVKPDAVAPDGSHVRILLGLSGGGLAHFEIGPGETSVAVAHHTVEEIWYLKKVGYISASLRLVI